MFQIPSLFYFYSKEISEKLFSIVNNTEGVYLRFNSVQMILYIGHWFHMLKNQHLIKATLKSLNNNK